MCTYIHNTHMHLFYLFVAMHAVGAAIYDEKYMPRLVAPLIFFLLFFVFLRPITKARPPRRPPLPFSPFLFLSFLTRHPSFLHAWHETSLWWSRLETFTAAYLSRSRADPCLPSVSMTELVRAHYPPSLPKLFAIFSCSSFASSLQECFLPRGQYLTNIDFGIHSSAHSPSLYFSIQWPFSHLSTTKYLSTSSATKKKKICNQSKDKILILNQY